MSRPAVRLQVRLIDKVGLVAQAGNGIEALENFRKHKSPSAILLDLMMPEMDGFEFLEEFQANEGWQNIPVIVLTSKDLTAEDRSRLSGGVEKVLTKGCRQSRFVFGKRKAGRF